MPSPPCALGGEHLAFPLACRGHAKGVRNAIASDGKPQDYMRPLRMTVLNWAVLNLRAEVSGVA